MSHALEVQTELELEQLEEIYKQASTVIEQRRAQVILLRAEGVPPGRVAHLVRIHPSTVTSYVRRFNEQGVTALFDARAGNQGRPALLDDAARQSLRQALEQDPAQGGRWTGPKATRWIESHLNLEANSLNNARGWEALKSLNYSYKSSRPRHVNSASEAERLAWKKNSPSV